MKITRSGYGGGCAARSVARRLAVMAMTRISAPGGTPSQANANTFFYAHVSSASPIRAGPVPPWCGGDAPRASAVLSSSTHRRTSASGPRAAGPPARDASLHVSPAVGLARGVVTRGTHPGPVRRWTADHPYGFSVESPALQGDAAPGLQPELPAQCRGEPGGDGAHASPLEPHRRLEPR